MLKELQYPFNATDILVKKKSLRRRLLSDSLQRIEKKLLYWGDRRLVILS